MTNKSNECVIKNIALNRSIFYISDVFRSENKDDLLFNNWLTNFKYECKLFSNSFSKSTNVFQLRKHVSFSFLNS